MSFQDVFWEQIDPNKRFSPTHQRLHAATLENKSPGSLCVSLTHSLWWFRTLDGNISACHRKGFVDHRPLLRSQSQAHHWVTLRKGCVSLYLGIDVSAFLWHSCLGINPCKLPTVGSKRGRSLTSFSVSRATLISNETVSWSLGEKGFLMWSSGFQVTSSMWKHDDKWTNLPLKEIISHKHALGNALMHTSSLWGTLINVQWFPVKCINAYKCTVRCTNALWSALVFSNSLWGALIP